MLCPNNVLVFQNFRFTIIAASLTVIHVFKYELRSTSTGSIIDSFMSYPYDRWEVGFKRYKIINV